jgi:hypothetical protein
MKLKICSDSFFIKYYCYIYIMEYEKDYIKYLTDEFNIYKSKDIKEYLDSYFMFEDFDYIGESTNLSNVYSYYVYTKRRKIDIIYGNGE